MAKKNKKPKYKFETCCNCAVTFGLTTELYEYRKKDGKEFYCPNGHPQHYTQLTDEQKKLQAERDSAVEENKRLKEQLAELAKKFTSSEK